MYVCFCQYAGIETQLQAGHYLNTIELWLSRWKRSPQMGLRLKRASSQPCPRSSESQNQAFDISSIIVLIWGESYSRFPSSRLLGNNSRRKDGNLVIPINTSVDEYWSYFHVLHRYRIGWPYIGHGIWLEPFNQSSLLPWYRYGCTMSADSPSPSRNSLLLFWRLPNIAKLWASCR